MRFVPLWRKVLKKVQKSCEKGLTMLLPGGIICKPTDSAPNLENDTETETQKETADSESSLAPAKAGEDKETG